MDDFPGKAEQLVSHLKEYVDNRADSVKLKIAEKSSAITATIIAAVIVGTVFFLFIVFGGVALAYALAGITGKMSLGFLIVAVIYLLVALVVWAGRRKLLQVPILNALLKQLFKEDEKN